MTADTKSVKQDSLRELNFLLAFILSEKFCGLFCKVFKSHYFENQDYRLLVSYIQAYFQKYSRPPKKLIVAYMEKHKTKFQDEVLYQSLKKTLITSAESIDELLEKYESPYIIDDAEMFIKAAELKRNVDEIVLALENKDEDAAMRIYSEITIPEVQKLGAITFEDDLDKQREALLKNYNQLIQFKDEVGLLAGPMYRGDFFTWVAPTETGKTWWLMWSAKQCREQGLNVLFLSLEMQEQSVLRRLQQMYYRRTLHGEDVTLPKFVIDNDNKYKVIHKKINAKKLEPQDVDELRIKAMGKHPHGRLKIVCRAGINHSDLKALLSELKYQGKFKPDVIVLDYADKMTSLKRVNDHREALGLIWKDLRDLALDQNILLITASQTNRASWDKHFTREAIAEDSRKLNEVTGAIGIMADKRDKKNGLIMLRQLKTRDGWYENRDVYSAVSFNIGQPCLQSVWANELIFPDDAAAEDHALKSFNGKAKRSGLGRNRKK